MNEQPNPNPNPNHSDWIEENRACFNMFVRLGLIDDLWTLWTHARPHYEHTYYVLQGVDLSMSKHVFRLEVNNYTLTLTPIKTEDIDSLFVLV